MTARCSLLQVSVLKAIMPIKLEDVVLGQYTGNEDGSQPGYKDGEWSIVANDKLKRDLHVSNTPR